MMLEDWVLAAFAEAAAYDVLIGVNSPRAAVSENLPLAQRRILLTARRT